jgi:hypothetical protein
MPAIAAASRVAWRCASPKYAGTVTMAASSLPAWNSARITIPWCIASSGEHEKMRLTLGLTGPLAGHAGPSCAYCWKI